MLVGVSFSRGDDHAASFGGPPGPRCARAASDRSRSSRRCLARSPPAVPTPASARPLSTTTRRCATTSSPPTRKRRPRSTPAPTSKAGRARAASSRYSPIPPTACRAVCRFFGTPGKGPNSHFYTADAAECAKVKTLPAVDVRGDRLLHPDADQRRLRRQLAGVSQLLHRQHRRRQSPLHGGPDGAHADDQRRGDVLEGVVMCAPVTERGAGGGRRALLEQATLGPTEALVKEVAGQGHRAWIDAQLAMNVTRYTQYPFWEPPQNNALCVDDKTPPVTPEKFCSINKYRAARVAWEFFRQSQDSAGPVAPAHGARLAPDLRHRRWRRRAYANADFQQRLRDNAFGTFEDLLVEIRAVAAARPVSELGQERSRARRHPAEREFRARADAALHDRRQRAERGWHAEARRQGPLFRPTRKPISRRSRASLPDSRIRRVPGAYADFWGNERVLHRRHDSVRRSITTKGPKSLLNGRAASLPPAAARWRRCAPRSARWSNHPNTPPFISAAAHPEDGDELAVRRATSRASRPCSRTTARACAAIWPRSRARSCSIPRRAARARSTPNTAACASRRCSGRR